ncbi:MAG: 3-dehydroquinate synthase family protein [Planctomycetota bacterium]
MRERLDIDHRESCRIHVGVGLGEELADFVRGRGVDRIAVVADPAVAARARALGERLGAAVVLEVPGGEAAKSLGRMAELAEAIFAAGLSRRSMIVAVGGGVVCDLAGFLAAIYMRGVDAVFVPTTLLGMVDAAVGGKNGVHLDDHKNLLGTIRQPVAVFADLEALATLPGARRGEGLVEVLKMAAMLDAAAFEELERLAPELVAGDREALGFAVSTGIRLKMEVVAADARESGRRMLLNFGHTVGHALETATNFRLSHGEAVAVGMVIECRMVGSPLGPRLRTLLDAIGVDSRWPVDCDRDRIWRLMTRDKKASGGVVLVAAPRALGRGDVVEVGPEDLARARP